MALDSAALPPDATAPIVDTPEAPAENTAGNTPTPPQPVDWESRYKAAQSELTRLAQARARERAVSSDVEEDEPDEGTEEAPTPAPRGRQSAALTAALERNAILERQVSESVHGPEAVSAYDQLVDMWNGAETESDRVTAALAFADMIRGVTPQPPAPPVAPGALPPREQAVAPRVDQNRSDAPAQDLELDPKQFEGANDGGRSFFAKQLEKIQARSR